MSDDRRIGSLYLESRSAAQRRAEERAAASNAVDAISLDAIRAGRVDLAVYDVCWWHRDRPLAITGRVIECRDALQSYLRDGGGLLLSGTALSSVAALGVDPVPPDATGREELPTPTGYLRKSIYADHPLFTGFDDLRVHTRGPTEAAGFARYERVLPERGDVLASTVRGDRDAPREVALCSWRVGDGAVLGAGVALSFADDEYADAGRRLVENALAFLADPDRPRRPAGRPKGAGELAALRGRLAEDPHRPRYHVTPPANWLNDPNGLIEWNGRYHLFYQYNPGGPYHNTIHWGHAVSEDLVRWRDEPVALTPSPNGPDRDGCWSGCATDDGGTATLLYTGGRDRVQLPCLATAADPSLRSWTKHDANPIIHAPPPELDVLETDHWSAEFRDHCAWREGDRWYHVIGTGLEGVGGAALLYVGDDPTEWEYVGPLLVGDWDGAGDVWECPEVLDLGERHLLHVSDYEDVRYFVGDLDRETGAFVPDEGGALDHGDFYAPQSMGLSDGRTLTWGWVTEARTEPAQWDAGWSGSLSLPRRLSLGEDGALRQRPARELTDLRTERVADADCALEADAPVPVADGRHLELWLDIALDGADALELHLLSTPDDSERTTVRYDGAGVVVDRGRSSLDPAADDAEQSMPVEGDALSLRAFLDGSVLELFANERRCLTSRAYPTQDDATGVSMESVGGPARVDWDAWRLGSAWESLR